MSNGSYNQSVSAKKSEVHPIWRGIGCLLFFITPFLSFAIANLIVLSRFLQRYIYIPPNFMRTITIPVLNYPVAALYATLVMTIVVMFLLFTSYFSIYAGLYKLFGPSPYGPMDVPPFNKKRKKTKSR